MKPASFTYRREGQYRYLCGLCKEILVECFGGSEHEAMQRARKYGFRCSMVHGWLCDACTAFYEAAGGFDRPEEQMPF